MNDASYRLSSPVSWLSRCTVLLQRCPPAAAWYLNHILELWPLAGLVGKFLQLDATARPPADTTMETMARDLALEAVRICGSRLDVANSNGVATDTTVFEFADLIVLCKLG